jgi:hypothetical protein
MQKLVVGASNNPGLQNLAYGAALGRVNFFKNKLLKDFDNHDVTKEIRSGPGNPSSKFLDVGNLFSFIGFRYDKQDEPILKIREILSEQTLLVKIPKSRKLGRSWVLTKFKVETPLLEDIWDVTEYPKGTGNIDRSGSWAKDLERRGIDGFEYYVFSYAFDSSFSRSTTGKQMKGKIRSKSFNKPIPYVRALLEDFRKKVTKK